MCLCSNIQTRKKKQNKIVIIDKDKKIKYNNNKNNNNNFWTQLWCSLVCNRSSSNSNASLFVWLVSYLV